jgi:hypothetical protein
MLSEGTVSLFIFRCPPILFRLPASQLAHSVFHLEPIGRSAAVARQLLRKNRGSGFNRWLEYPNLGNCAIGRGPLSLCGVAQDRRPCIF